MSIMDGVVVTVGSKVRIYDAFYMLESEFPRTKVEVLCIRGKGFVYQGRVFAYQG